MNENHENTCSPPLTPTPWQLHVEIGQRGRRDVMKASVLPLFQLLVCGFKITATRAKSVLAVLANSLSTKLRKLQPPPHPPSVTVFTQFAECTAKIKLCGLGPRANYTNRATAACRRN
jgi:hypothetical protein